MKFSTLKYADFTWTAITVYNKAGSAIANSTSINVLRITNLSGENRVYSINKGPPIAVPTGFSYSMDLYTNGCPTTIDSVEYSAATLTGHYVDGV